MRSKFLFIALLLVSGLSFAQTSTDEAAIKKVIEAEHNASRQRDLTKLLTCFAKSDDLVFGFIPGIGMVRGYDALVKGIKAAFEKNPKPLEGTTAISDYRIRQQGNTSFVSSIAMSTLPDGSQVQTNKVAYLEKLNGEWKIVGNLFSNEPIKSRNTPIDPALYCPKLLLAMTQETTAHLLTSEAIAEFKDTFKGILLRSGEDGYDQARAVWNGMIDKCPALIARCTNSVDVISAVRFARKHHLLVSVRGGGHNIAGNAVCAGGLMIDLSLMKAISVDAAKLTARAEAGVLWNELDQATQEHGLATTGGTVSHTGIAGLTLGGGLGWLMGKHGLTCDNLLSVEMVTADGDLLTASETENEDLFWAVRGGGGNFGVVTSFTYQLHPVGPTILGGMVLYPQDQAKEVLRFYRDFARSTTDELMIFAGLFNTPDGLPVVALLVGWFGPLAEGEQHLKPLRDFGAPLADLIAEIPYIQHQTLFDAATPHGLHRYWKSGNLPEIEDNFIDVVIAQAARQPSPFSFILFFHMKGAVARVDPTKTAFGLREDQWDFDIVSQWTDPADNQINIDWTRTFWSQVEPYTKGVYVNHLGGEEEATRVRAAYGPNYERLVALKTKYDPENFFRLNNNIVPN